MVLHGFPGAAVPDRLSPLPPLRAGNAESRGDGRHWSQACHYTGLWEHALLCVDTSSTLCGPGQGVLVIQVLSVELEAPGRRLGKGSRNFRGETYFLGDKRGCTQKYKTFIFARACNANTTFIQNLSALPVSFGGI